jgi:hypothetical protein
VIVDISKLDVDKLFELYGELKPIEGFDGMEELVLGPALHGC